MKTFAVRALLRVLALIFVVLGAGPRLGAGETNANTNTTAFAEAAGAITSEQALAAYLHVQDQLKTAQHKLEDLRFEAAVAARSNAAFVAEQLRRIEQAVTAQHLRDLEVMRDSNRTALLVVGAVALAAFLLLVLAGWLQLQSAQKFSEAVLALRMPGAFGPAAPLLTLGSPQTAEASPDPAQQASAQFQAVLQRLQRRIEELEHIATPLPSPASDGRNRPESAGRTPPNGAPTALGAGAGETAPGSSNEPARSAVMIQKVQALLNMDRPEEALACCAEALAGDPNNAELLVKQGTVLERLQQSEEAIASYDRAITLQKTLTNAYLLKGGALNRMKRFSEALECYEQALRNGARVQG